MNKRSVEKLQEAGYVFLRERDIPGKCGVTHYAVMQSREFGVWTVLEKFDKKVARKRRLEELSRLSNILTD
jgi:hypothetical protein